MKKILTLALLASALAFTACSKEESVTEKISQKVDQINTENADAAVKKIRTPLDKARATQNLGVEHTEGIDQALQNQTK